MRIPDEGPLGETFFDARLRAIAEALRVKSPAGGWVESVLTFDTQRFFFAVATDFSTARLRAFDAPNE